MLRPEWRTILLAALVVVSAPVAGAVLVARPGLGVAAGVGLLTGLALGIGHRPGRRVIASVSGTLTRHAQATGTARRAAYEE